MICFPNCKINLGLYITEKRPDGYHNLETVFYPVKGLHDALEIITSDTSALHTDGIAIAGNKEDNLVWKAYGLLKQDFPEQVKDVDIHLLKQIPMGAGMGGGSADGAFMLALLNDYFSLGMDKPALAQYALQLGSDCPFFIYNSPQYARGRGELMAPIDIDLSSFSLQLVCPEVHISTKDAFAMIKPRPATFDLRTLATTPVAEWRNVIVNDFEAPVFAQHPELEDIKKQLYNHGALYASMSGSGSTIFGIFPKGQRASISSPLTTSISYL